VSKAKPYYSTTLYDGEKSYFHSQTHNGKQPDKIGIDPNPGTNLQEYVASSGDPLQGKMYGDYQYIDAIFRDPGSTVTVRRKTERMGDADCYVIEAKTNRGRYTVWIDPEHGYNIAKAEVGKSGKDMQFRKPLDQCIVMGRRFVGTKNSVADVQFQKIGDLWVPMQATFRNATHFSDGSKSVSTQRYRRTEVIVNPDHKALGSFAPKFPNGSTVRVYGEPRVRYTWRDGKYVEPENLGRKDGEAK
jgi:hypothetical protein